MYVIVGYRNEWDFGSSEARQIMNVLGCVDDTERKAYGVRDFLFKFHNSMIHTAHIDFMDIVNQLNTGSRTVEENIAVNKTAFESLKASGRHNADAIRYLRENLIKDDFSSYESLRDYYAMEVHKTSDWTGKVKVF